MQIISLGKEINCFEGMGLNGLCPIRILLSLIESRALEGERVSTYWCMSVILCSPFSILLSNSSFFSFFFLNVLLIFVVILLEFPITLFVIFFFLFFPMHGKSPLYSVCRDRILLF